MSRMISPANLFCLSFCLAVSFSASAQNWAKVYNDTNSVYIHTATISKKKYIAFFNEQTFYLLNSKGDTLITKSDYYNDYEFKDFNKDGHPDIILHQSGNTPGVLDLFLFLPARETFREVKQFRDFPDPKQINGTKYYYSIIKVVAQT